MNLLEHYRRPQQQIDDGRWWIECDCGWKGSTPCDTAGRVKVAAEIEPELEAQFTAHLPAAKRRSYLLIDQRSGECEDEHGKLITLPRGNFLMPGGEPVTLVKWRTEDGVRLGLWLIPETGETGELPVGEVRTADNRVFKLDE